MVLVRATTTTDWQALREIRLQALLDAPDAFASTHAREAAFGEDEWRQRAGRDGSFIAFLSEVCPGSPSPPNASRCPPTSPSARSACSGRYSQRGIASTV